jgi:serine/threonine-protein kinase
MLPAADPCLERGALFAERYEVCEPVGEGGMSRVYRVIDRRLDEAVALKLLTRMGEEDVERFRREVRLARRITHPNVARIHDLGAHEGRHFLTMELIEGPTLEQLMTAGLSRTRAVDIAIDVCHGLDAAHRMGIVHRDLKPSNVMLTRERRVVLTDFGVARSVVGEGVTHTTSTLIGTPAYMAPEQVLGEDVDERSDIYGLGMMLYEMLTGTLPFLEAGNALATALARCQRPPPDPRDEANLPGPLAALVLYCLQHDPSARPASAAAVADSLDSWLRSASGEDGQRVTVRPSQPTQDSDVASMRTSAARGVEAVPRTARAHAPMPARTGVSTRTGGALAPLLSRARAIAVLPLRYRGPKDDDYLADGLAEELIDTLARNRHLRIIAFSAIEGYRERREPKLLADELDVEAVVDGTLQKHGDKLRITARLVAAPAGTQLWSERFELSTDELFELQETIVQRVAEALRVRLEATHHSDLAPELVPLYMRARDAMRARRHLGEGGSVALLERCIELDPSFGPALAAHAIACLWVMWEDATSFAQHAAAAEQSVDRALAGAGDLADAHLAAAMWANQQGDPAAAASALIRALEIAPAHAEAQRYLGELQCEAGRLDEGRRRLRLALQLDPSRRDIYLPLARLEALEGNWQAADELLAKAYDDDRDASDIGVLMTRMRLASWRDDGEALAATRKLASKSRDPSMYVVVELADYLLGGDAPQLDASGAGDSRLRLRLEALLHQIYGEAHAARGDQERALTHLEAAADGALFDLFWLERCPLLDALRSSPRYEAVRAKVEARAASIWRR